MKSPDLRSSLFSGKVYTFDRLNPNLRPKPSYDSISLYYKVLNADVPLDLTCGDRGFRFMCCFRFKLWWMTQRMGSSGREVPYETQFMLLEGPSADRYTVMLPILDGAFRASLQGNDEDELQLCLESGGEL